MIVGSGKYTYRVVTGWGRGAEGREPGGIVTAVATDSLDRVYVFVRKPAAMLVYDRDGRFLSAWGENVFDTPHGLWISDQDILFCADSGDHTIRQFTPDGVLLKTFGTPGQPGAPTRPFNMPTKAVLSSNGEMYVSDGYGQFRVHRFATDGTAVCSWGEKGAGPGQFALPHSIAVHRAGQAFVVDRENNRIQIFDAAGTFLAEWLELLLPMDVFMGRDDAIFVAEAHQRVDRGIGHAFQHFLLLGFL